MASSTDYTGRSVDLSIFLGAQAQGEQQLVLDFSDGGDVITGIQKMIQTFTMLFLTEIGSVLYQPSLGCSFITAMRLGAIRNEGDVQAQFDLAIEQIRQTMDLVADAASLPPDETFDSAELTSFDLNTEAGKLTLKIALKSQAGASRVIYLPVPLAIQ